MRMNQILRARGTGYRLHERLYFLINCLLWVLYWDVICVLWYYNEVEGQVFYCGTLIRVIIIITNLHTLSHILSLPTALQLIIILIRKSELVLSLNNNLIHHTPQTEKDCEGTMSWRICYNMTLAGFCLLNNSLVWMKLFRWPCIALYSPVRKRKINTAINDN